MKLADLIKNIVIPLISVATAVMVGFLNHQVSENDLKLRERDQELRQRLGEIDLLVKKTKEEREERESNQDFNLKIYDIVTKSLEENDARKQETAKAFVVVMVEEPLRSSLLNVLKQGGAPEVKQNISKILEAEEKFQTNVAMVPEQKRVETSTYTWGEWDFDIFWCSTSGAKAKAQAEIIGEQLVAEGAEGRIRIRELPESINAKSGYQIDGYAIRRNSNEIETAAALQSLAENALDKSGSKTTFTQSLTRQSTPWYVSAFLCPSS
jgi:hypothetical protein